MKVITYTTSTLAALKMAVDSSWCLYFDDR